MTRLLLVLGLLLFATSASAAENVPAYDIDQECADLTKKPEFATDTGLKACLGLEHVSLDVVQYLWPKASGDVRAACVRKADAFEHFHYMALERCIREDLGLEWMRRQRQTAGPKLPHGTLSIPQQH